MLNIFRIFRIVIECIDYTEHISWTSDFCLVWFRFHAQTIYNYIIYGDGRGGREICTRDTVCPWWNSEENNQCLSSVTSPNSQDDSMTDILSAKVKVKRWHENLWLLQQTGNRKLFGIIRKWIKSFPSRKRWETLEITRSWTRTDLRFL